MGPLTWATIALITLFGTVDGAAHLTKYKYGETFSALIWWAEKRAPVLKLVVAAACVLLGVHLVFHLP